jgi:hypothetical protein
LAPNTTYSAVDVASATSPSDKSSIESPLDTPDNDEVLRKSSKIMRLVISKTVSLCKFLKSLDLEDI